MDYISHEEIASITLFDVRVSESELMVYESCVKYVVDNCPEDDLYAHTGCKTKLELDSIRIDPILLIKKHMLKEFLPQKYINKEYLPKSESED